MFVFRPSCNGFLQDKVPASVTTLLTQMAVDKRMEQETTPSRHVQFEDHMSHVQNVIIGSNAIATDAAIAKAEKLGYIPVILSNTLQVFYIKVLA